MKYKSGDIIVYDQNHKQVYLVLEVDDKEKVYKVFALNHCNKFLVGKNVVVTQKYTLSFFKLQFYSLLKDEKL